MLHWVRHAYRWVVVLVALWVIAVYGLPTIRRTTPRLCTQWNIQGGFCGGAVQSALTTMDRWTKRVLLPLPLNARVRLAATEVRRQLGRVEDAARSQVGDQHVDDALRGADQALSTLEDVVRRTGDARDKIAQVPENLEELLGRVRRAFDRLRHVLGTAGRSAEEVSQAVNEATRALDALSGILP